MLETKSPTIEWPFSDSIDKKELLFREEQEKYDNPEQDLINWITKKRVIDLFEYFLKKTKIQFYGIVIDLGAGSCWLSSLISKFEKVQKIYAVEFSKRRLELLAPVAMRYLGAIESKIIRVVGDFNKIELSDNSVDFVVMDGALHHSQNLQITMKEINRILKKDGYFVAFREATLAKWRPTHRNIKTRTKQQYGEFENIYSKNEYIKIIENRTQLKAKAISGPMFSPRSSIITFFKRYTPLSFFNGLLFADFIYLGEKK